MPFTPTEYDDYTREQVRTWTKEDLEAAEEKISRTARLHGITEKGVLVLEHVRDELFQRMTKGEQVEYIKKEHEHWKQYSAVIVGNWVLHIDSGNERWALFWSEDYDKGEEFKAGEDWLISVLDGTVIKHQMGLMETLFSAGVTPLEVKQLLCEYMDFLWEPYGEEEDEA